MTRGLSPTHDTSAHENRHRNPGRREARARYLDEREARRQAAVAAAVVSWDPGAA